MIDAVSTALSGLTSATKRLSVSAANIANANVDGKYPARGEKTDTYLPKDVFDFSQVTGGVLPQVVTRKDGYRPHVNPDHAQANADGLTARPDVRIDEEFVNQKLSQLQYAANASVIKAELDNEKKLLDVLV